MTPKATRKPKKQGTDSDVPVQTLPIVPITELSGAEYNPRSISKADMEALKRSITEFGIVEPVVVNKDNTVIGGHQRIVACRELGIVGVPVYYVDLDKQKEKVLNLALNRIHGTWNIQKLAVVLSEIKMADMTDLDLTGFDKYELQDLEELSTGDFERPDNKGLIEEFEQPESGKSKKDQNWLYVEYYGDNERFAQLTAMIESILVPKNKRQLDSDKFFEVVKTWHQRQQNNEDSNE